MQIYVHKNNQQVGPFTEDEIKAQLAAGTISLQDHVWWQGQPSWMPLGQTSLAPGGPVAAPIPGVAGGPATFVPGAVQPTSKLAIWALVCGCLSLFCSLLASIPAIVLGHMGLSQIKKNPGMQGKGMALAGMILGYIFTTLIVIYVIAIAVLFSTNNQVKDIFKTISSQLAAQQAAQAANNSDESTTTNSDQTTNAPDQTTPSSATNNADSSTNSAPSSSDSSTNAAPANP